ncbi:sugar MFS transporter [Sphingobacterium olei]|uniref:Sugar MFS transporter n=1 Tax=Sphingobacterium olei TaxID=2571155 RepID=A0A4U0NCL2_9SPHI|nr:MFS transporter [Sphingobacterium olei]TJZ51747.1 sugar MFS transporter [Sphingobacterium olei]
MQSNKENKSPLVLIPIFLNFFIMGFVDIVGVATNYVKKDFVLSETTASIIPMMVFVWFAVCAVPTGVLMGKIGRKKTVAVSLVITALAMGISFLVYSYLGILFAFALLGIGNTILQVSLNPLVASVVRKEKLTSILTMGQFIKAIASFLGPILVGFAATQVGDWRFIFLFYGLATILSIVVLYTLHIDEPTETVEKSSSFRKIFTLLNDKYLINCILVIVLIVGIDVGLNTSIPQLLMDRLAIPLEDAALGTSLYFAARTIGTFVGALLLVRLSAVKFLRGTIVLAVLAFVGMIFSSSLWGLLAAIVIVGLACANVFSIIFSLALQHDMKHANEISALMIMGVSGGALVLPLQGLITDMSSFTAGLSVILVSMLIIGSISYKFKY